MKFEKNFSPIKPIITPTICCIKNLAGFAPISIHFGALAENIAINPITTRKITGLAVDNGAAVVFKDDEIYALHGNDGGKAYFLSNDGTKSE